MATGVESLRYTLVILSLAICGSCDNSNPHIRHLSPTSIHHAHALQGFTAEQDRSYYFDYTSGKCINSSGEEGHYKSKLRECGDISGQKIDSRYIPENLFGLIATGSDLSDSEIDLLQIAEQEVLIDEKTILPTRYLYPYATLYHAFKLLYRRTDYTLSRLKRILKLAHIDLEKYKEKLRATNRYDSEYLAVLGERTRAIELQIKIHALQRLRYKQQMLFFDDLQEVDEEFYQATKSMFSCKDLGILSQEDFLDFVSTGVAVEVNQLTPITASYNGYWEEYLKPKIKIKGTACDFELKDYVYRLGKEDFNLDRRLLLHFSSWKSKEKLLAIDPSSRLFESSTDFISWCNKGRISISIPFIDDMLVNSDSIRRGLDCPETLDPYLNTDTQRLVGAKNMNRLFATGNCYDREFGPVELQLFNSTVNVDCSDGRWSTWISIDAPVHSDSGFLIASQTHESDPTQITKGIHIAIDTLAPKLTWNLLPGDYYLELEIIASEIIVGLDKSVIKLGNASLIDLQESNPNKRYILRMIPHSVGTVTVQVTSDSIADLHGNTLDSTNGISFDSRSTIFPP